MLEQSKNIRELAQVWPAPDDTPSRAAHRARVRALNDALRCGGEGGRVLVTPGVSCLPTPTYAAVLTAVATFTAFDAGNDPYGEHDFGAVEVGGEVYFWKIDTYDLDLVGASPDPADPEVTARVLTIMRGAEY